MLKVFSKLFLLRTSFFDNLVKWFIKKEIKAQFPKELNKMVFHYFFERSIIIFIILSSYFVAKVFKLNIKLLVAFITLAIGLYICFCCIYLFINYFLFCFREKKLLGPYTAAMVFTAEKVELIFFSEHPKIWTIFNSLHIDTEKISRKAAEDVILYDKEIRKALNIKILWYALIYTLYIISYSFIYNKVININFEGFLHPFFWSILYLYDWL